MVRRSLPVFVIAFADLICSDSCDSIAAFTDDVSRAFVNPAGIPWPRFSIGTRHAIDVALWWRILICVLSIRFRLGVLKCCKSQNHVRSARELSS